MVKKVFWAALVVVAATSAFAQEVKTTEEVQYSTDKYKVETNRFWSNWFLSVGGGAQIYFGDHDKQAKFGDRLSPALDVAVGKWFTPGIGVRLMYSGLSLKGATQTWNDRANYGAHSTGKEIAGWEHGFLDESKFKFYNIHADVMFNMSNLLCGYNEKRIWNCSPYLGVGWMATWESPRAREVSANFGILNSFRLNKYLDLNLDVRSSIVKEAFDGEYGGRKEEGLVAATVGLTYKFKKRGWDRSKTVIRNSYTDISGLQNQLADLASENERLKNELANKDNVVVKDVKVAPLLVIFKIGKADLSKEARVNLGFLADAIKNSEEKVVYTVTGYADAGTGSKKFNEELSRKRAEAVYNCLKDEFGVPEDQLRIDYKGGVDNMYYNDPRLSRAVITRTE